VEKNMLEMKKEQHQKEIHFILPLLEIPRYAFHYYNLPSHKRAWARYIFHEILRSFLVNLLQFAGGNAMETEYFKQLDTFKW